MDSMPNMNQKRSNVMMSCGQFRPEKNHHEQLLIWRAAKPLLPEDSIFYICGGTRGKDDIELVKDLKQIAVEMGIDKSVKFCVDQPRSKLLEIFA